ncbi:MAG: hypothetical protein FWG64_12935 [Firmicutes bacterium]|nr:hypothetical protein [Bacillota bacterium]
MLKTQQETGLHDSQGKIIKNGDIIQNMNHADTINELKEIKEIYDAEDSTYHMERIKDEIRLSAHRGIVYWDNGAFWVKLINGYGETIDKEKLLYHSLKERKEKWQIEGNINENFQLLADCKWCMNCVYYMDGCCTSNFYEGHPDYVPNVPTKYDHNCYDWKGKNGERLSYYETVEEYEERLNKVFPISELFA